MEQDMWMDDPETLAEVRTREPLRRRNRKNYELMEGIRIERADDKSRHRSWEN